MKNFNLTKPDWTSVISRLRRKEYADLLREYQHLLNLAAKTVQQLKLEQLIEEELKRRSS
jgi:hypothetical protein